MYQKIYQLLEMTIVKVLKKSRPNHPSKELLYKALLEKIMTQNLIKEMMGRVANPLVFEAKQLKRMFRLQDSNPHFERIFKEPNHHKLQLFQHQHHHPFVLPLHQQSQVRKR
jgi:hypothetical protein